MPVTTKQNFDRARAALRFVDYPHFGNVFFVSSVTGSATGGYTPDAPAATIEQALQLCTANKGDTIFLGPGHTETLAAAAGLDLDVAGITIKGLGNGTLRPRIKLGTADTVDVDIDAANITIEDVDFEATVADIVAAIDVNADDFTARRCRFLGTTDLNAKIWVQDAAAGGSDRITIEDCYCYDVDAANTHFINFAGTGDGHIIRRNVLVGDWGTAAIGGAGVITNAYCCDNQIYNAATDNDACINFAATATGICDRNLCGGGAAQANGITATAMAQSLNYYGVLSEDLQSILDPIGT